jgi:SAM-dependent methyltransferase
VTARDVPLHETLEFIAPRLRKGARVLEVGAGGCELAAKLAWRGVRMTALDLEIPNELSPIQNLDTVQKDFLDFSVSDPKDRFDAILFTRSLHHIAPLERALDRALEVLAPGGLFVAEEFSLEAPDRPTLRGYYDAMDLLSSAGLIDQREHAHEHAHANAEDVLERWRVDHDEDPPLNTGAHMMAEVAARFDAIEVMTCPYLYRTLAERLDDAERGEAIARHLFAIENQRIDRGEIRPVGLRICAHKRR